MKRGRPRLLSDRRERKMELSIIASGSNGNCYLVQSAGTSILIDAGKSYRETALRMACHW